ncbi:hypothetical protein BV22DRAFT_1037136 [Leucogyrophana mollusca]|uniref:Uncharacterized protein n=1 Tax=Leucogyrophana mollusca TaxID=85980 RepID=A0ACB8BDI9_9AGAM|nr:hypothetical protein BV22DRAFT_1037136 [Leucogyrophana mollusca]
MSLLKRLWQRVARPTYFVGRDLEGNKYFEFPGTSNDFGRTKRTVKYRRNEDMWAYVANGKRLPVQWSAWLTHTRPNVPTIQELQADVARQQRVRMNAAILEARDQEERARVARIDAAPISPSHSSESYIESTEVRSHPSLAPEATSIPPPREPTSKAPDPWSKNRTASDEPEAWAPRARRRDDQ